MNYSKSNTKDAKKNAPPIEKKNYGTTVKKESVSDKLFKRIVKTDMETFKNHMIDNVIIPKCIQLVRDTIVNSVDMFFYGKTNISKTGGTGGYFAYNSCSTPYGGSRYSTAPTPTQSSTQYSSQRTAARGMEGIMNVVFPSRDKACEYINDLRMRCAECSGISLLEAECMIEGLTANFTDDRFGWKDPNLFTEDLVTACPDGFCVNLPKMLEFTNR